MELDLLARKPQEDRSKRRTHHPKKKSAPRKAEILAKWTGTGTGKADNNADRTGEVREIIGRILFGQLRVER